jgi:ADP-ribose pyrophosphatase YjhB (NUDIX family)
VDEPVAPGAVLRPTVRVLLLDAQDRVLLFEMHTADGRVFWCPPGGGIDGDESPEDASLRELREETGWRDPSIGPLIGHRRHVVTWNDGITYDCRERWYLARVDALEVDDAGWTEDERLDMGRHHWWTLDELRGTDEDLTPTDLADRVRTILTEGPPRVPWELDR